MTKQEIKQDLKRTFGDAGFVNVGQFAKFMGIKPNAASRRLRGLEYIEMGRQRKYTIDDIAGLIIESRKAM